MMLARTLALVTDAYGGAGGIAQYNRDFLDAVAETEGVDRVHILPRLRPRPTGALPTKTLQYPPIHNQFLYSFRALTLALQVRPTEVFCGHLFMAPLGALCARMFGAKLIVQTHGIEVWPVPNWLQKISLEAADLVLCVSRDTRRRILKWANSPPERLVVVPNTVSEVYQPGARDHARDKFGFDSKKKILLTVSRLDATQKYKGHDLVIPLIPDLVENGHDVIYVVAGVGDDTSRLAELARRVKVADRVLFLGEVPYIDLPDLYRAADLYVMPSSGEGFGIVFLEAMSSGTPAVGLAIGGATDALCDGELGIACQRGELLSIISAALAVPPSLNGEALAKRVAAKFDRSAFRRAVSGALKRVRAPNGGATNPQVMHQ